MADGSIATKARPNRRRSRAASATVGARLARATGDSTGTTQRRHRCTLYRDASRARAELLVQSCRLARLVVALRKVRRAARGGGIELGGKHEIAVPLVEMRGDGVTPRD